MNGCCIRLSVIRAAAAALIAGGAAAVPSLAQQPAVQQAQVSAPAAGSDELVDAPGREKAVQCGACHSLDYIRMNSRFLDLAGWTAVVNKMVKVYGAPVPTDEVDAIARYLAQNYGKTTPPPPSQ